LEGLKKNLPWGEGSQILWDFEQ